MPGSRVNRRSWSGQGTCHEERLPRRQTPVGGTTRKGRVPSAYDVRKPIRVSVVAICRLVNVKKEQTAGAAVPRTNRGRTARKKARKEL
jgi:hypothetical protein